MRYTSELAKELTLFYVPVWCGISARRAIDTYLYDDRSASLKAEFSRNTQCTSAPGSPHASVWGAGSISAHLPQDAEGSKSQQATSE